MHANQEFPVGPRPVYLSGWRRNLRRLSMLPMFIRYLSHPSQYPRFILRRSRNGFLRTLEIERQLGLTKFISFNGSLFASLSLPHFPSAAFDYAASRGALNVGGMGTDAKLHIDNAILAITSRCEYGCSHCYERRNIGSSELVPIERWQEVIAQLQEIGVSIVILSGGEPMLRFDGVLELLRSGDKNRSDFHVHTSGAGVTAERARTLRDAGLTAAAVGLDDVDPARFDALRGKRGAFDQAVKALVHFNNAGIFTYTNLCLTPQLVRSGDLWKYFELARELHVGLIELLEPRPCGGYRGKTMESLFTEADRKAVREFIDAGNHDVRYRDYPLLYSIPEIEHPSRLGCTMGGLSHLTIDSSGSVNPCVFVPISFGNILHENLAPIVSRMRQAVPTPIHAGCGSVLLADLLEAHNKDGKRTSRRFEEIEDEWHARLGV
ncbi:MAG TPA: radical SAM protein [Bacteroidota bacterium]|nr:radical SAM protein [Bacteroidota bacterium]